MDGITGPEFRPEQGKNMIVVCALYGLKSASASFRSFMVKKLDKLGFQSSKADLDIWLWPTIKSDGDEYYECVRLYVDDVMTASHNALQVMNDLGNGIHYHFCSVPLFHFDIANISFFAAARVSLWWYWFTMVEPFGLPPVQGLLIVLTLFDESSTGSISSKFLFKQNFLKAKLILFFVIQGSCALASFRIFVTYPHGNFLVLDDFIVLNISVHTRSRNLLRSSLEASFKEHTTPESAIV